MNGGGDDEDYDDDVFLFLLLLLTATWQSIISVPLSFRDYLSADERRRRSGHLRRGALQNPNVAPFWQIYNSGQDDAMITFTGFDFAAFNQLHQVFQPLFDNFTPFNNRMALLFANALRLAVPDF